MAAAGSDMAGDPDYRRLELELGQLQEEEERVRAQSRSNQDRQHALIRNQRQLEKKALAVKKNVDVLDNRVMELTSKIKLTEREHRESEEAQRVIISRLHTLEQKQQSLMEAMEASESELQRNEKTITEQQRERNKLVNRNAELNEEHDSLMAEMAVINAAIEKKTSAQSAMMRHLDMLQLELKAQEQAKSPQAEQVARQIADKEQRVRQLSNAILELRSNVKGVESKLHEVVLEQDQIAALLPTLELTSRDIRELRARLTRKLGDMRRSLRRLNAEDNSVKRELSRAQKATTDLNNKLDGMRKVRSALVEERDKLTDVRKRLDARLQDVRAGDETISARLQQDQYVLDALKRKRLRITHEKAQFHRRLTLGMHAPHPPAGPPPASAKRTSSQCASGSLLCVIRQKQVRGTLTATSYLVIFEATDEKNEQFRFCVDMQDVVSCRIQKLPERLKTKSILEKERSLRSQSAQASSVSASVSAPTSSPLSSTLSAAPSSSHNSLTNTSDTNEAPEPFVLLVLTFREKYRNRFLFNEMTGQQEHSDAFGSEVQFVVARKTASSLFEAIHQAILYHEDLMMRSLSAGQSNKAPSPSVTSRSVPDSPVAADQKSRQSVRPSFDVAVHEDSVSEIVSALKLQQILHAVPRRFQLEEWKLVFSITRDGTSLSTFYARTAALETSVLIFQDSGHKVFGGYASKPWHEHQLYYGDGECFVFDFPVKGKRSFGVYRWTGKNDYFMASHNDYIAMGGGDHNAFRVDNQLEKGTSGHCATFGSPQLSSTPDFTCHKLEVWAPQS